MSDLLLKIKRLVPITSTKKNSYDRNRVRPARDWKIVLVSSSVAIALLAGLCTYFYFEIEAGRLFVVYKEGEESEVKINLDLLEKVAGEIDKRNSDFESVKNGKTIPSDPSL